MRDADVERVCGQSARILKALSPARAPPPLPPPALPPSPALPALRQCRRRARVRALTVRTMPQSAPELSVVIPVYNEEEVLPALFARLYPALDALGAQLRDRVRQRWQP